MSRRAWLPTGVVILGLASGCAYERGVGWHYDPYAASDAVRDVVFDSVFSLIPDHRTPAERAEDDADEFFNRD